MASINKALESLNSSNSFLPIIRAREMSLGHYYMVKSFDVKRTTFGKRGTLSLVDETYGTASVLFLPPSFVTDEKKKANISKLFGDSEKKVFIKVDSFFENQSGFQIPIFHFKVE